MGLRSRLGEAGTPLRVLWQQPGKQGQLPVEGERQQSDVLIRGQAEEDGPQAAICNAKRGWVRSALQVPPYPRVSSCMAHQEPGREG